MDLPCESVDSFNVAEAIPASSSVHRKLLNRSSFIRDDLIVQETLKRHEHQYIVYENYKVYCATWNVNGKACYANSPLELWLAASKEAPDIYAIALQEVDLSTAAVVLNKADPHSKWNDKLLKSLNSNGDYRELRSVRLVGMMLTIFVRKEILSHINRCVTKKITRGILNALGNKGGVAVSIKLNEGSLCFVNSHLAAHTDMVDSRNEDYESIETEMDFGGDLRSIGEHDHIFWLGDLNYRLDHAQFECLDINDYKLLMKHDQLRLEMTKGNCFHGYREGDIKFSPTYKYDVGTDNFDSSKKQRAPAYCDRILWKGSRIDQLTYNSVMKVRQSDHKPVYAVFDVKVKTRDHKRYERLLDEAFKRQNSHDKEFQPQILIEKSVIDFGEVRFNERSKQYFTVWNKGQTIVKFEFRVKDHNAICEEWVQVQPNSANIFPGSSKKIEISVMIDANSVGGLLRKICTTRKVDLDILVLHVENGSDVFIVVTGEYKPSCFGLSMETLCRTAGPLCDLTQTDVKELLCSESLDFRRKVPDEFLMLCKYLKGKAITGTFSNLLYKDTMSVEFDEKRDWLDSWSIHEFPGTPNAAAEALLMLLDLPEEPLLHPYVEELLRTITTCDAIVIISKLQEPRKMIFWELCVLLKVGIERHYYDIDDAALTFGRILLRNPTPEADSKRDTLCHDFMQRFLKVDTFNHGNSKAGGYVF